MQLQHAAGMRYFDLTNQRERFDDTVGKQVQIDFYELKKSILVNVTDGIETCQEYCPIDPDDKMEKFDPFDPFDKVKDLGKTSYEGQLVEHYQWSDMIFKIIKMQTTDFYAAFSGDTATPVAANTVITPFGSAPIGSQNQTWTNWKPVRRRLASRVMYVRLTCRARSHVAWRVEHVPLRRCACRSSCRSMLLVALPRRCAWSLPTNGPPPPHRAPRQRRSSTSRGSTRARALTTAVRHRCRPTDCRPTNSTRSTATSRRSPSTRSVSDR